MDALDAPRSRQKLGKKEKQKYAKEMASKDLLIPPKDGLAAWMSNPSLLPKYPPGRLPPCEHIRRKRIRFKWKE